MRARRDARCACAGIGPHSPPVFQHQPEGRGSASTAIVDAAAGEPVGPRYIDWNFVSSSPDRLEQARADWAAGRMKLPDLDNEDFIPLPPKPGAMPEPMS
ncbi:MAG TPA: pirin-like C-terminal cupin domain-containing protein [Rhodanobacter sp.]|nr:pirin-like C-terminal cupin domain-containing protein [Rhodanobacter sp.]